jgi:Regulator of ribonuclease activity B
MASQVKGAKPGDILVIRVKSAVAYLQYVGEHPAYGDAVVVGRMVPAPASVIDRRVVEGGYITFYPLRLAVARGLVEIVGHAPPPDVPGRLRLEGATIGGRVATWVILDGASKRVTSRLSDEEVRLPIVGLWNHEALVTSIESAYTPTSEGRGDGNSPDVDLVKVLEQARQGHRDATSIAEPLGMTSVAAQSEAIAQLTAATGGTRPRTFAHYLYVGSEKVAKQMTAEVAALGFEASRRRGAEGDWLVLARQSVVPSEEVIGAARRSLEALAERLGGEYDGWQAATG